MNPTDNGQKTILVICFTNLARDPRVYRQLRFLQEGYHVVAAGLSDPQIPGIEFIGNKRAINQRVRVGLLDYAVCRLNEHTRQSGQPWLFLPTRLLELMRVVLRFLKESGVANLLRFRNTLRIWARRLNDHVLLTLRQYDRVYWRYSYPQRFWGTLSGVQADVIIANDLNTLPLALRLAQQNHAKVIFDAHEYFPRQYEDRLSQRLFYRHYRTYLCNTYIPHVDGMMTASPGYAEQYEKDTGVKALPIINAPNYHNLQPRLQPAHEPRIHMIHHGIASRARQIEQMIAVMDHLDERFELDLMLVANPGDQQRYMDELKRRASANPRIRFLPPVPMRELVTVSHQYDIGLFLLPPTSFSYIHTLPNKLFEFIQARLAVAIGPSTQMARFVREYDCGVVADTFAPRSLAEQLQPLDHTRINYYKQQSHKAASTLCAEHNRTLLRTLVAQVLQQER